MEGIEMTEEWFKGNIDEGLNDNIYNQLAKDFAKLQDVDLAMTPLADLITGYVRYKELEKRMEIATDKLYCWGEALDPVFQQEMLDILKIRK